jgi:hypothetical protein
MSSAAAPAFALSLALQSEIEAFAARQEAENQAALTLAQAKHDVLLSAAEAKYNKLVSTNAELAATNQKLQEELCNLTKVSQIIAYEKENSKLRHEIELLKAALAPPPAPAPFKPAPALGPGPIPIKSDTAALAPAPAPGPIKSKPEKASEKAPEKESDEIDLLEITIQSRKLYVTDDAERTLYERLPDDEIGQVVGHLNARGKPVWL